MKTVVGLGELLWDVYPDTRRLGGAPANVALHAQCMNARGVIASAVGDDELGQDLIHMLKFRMKEMDTIQIHPEKSTGTVRVMLDDQGNPAFACSTDTAFDHMIWNESLDQLVKSTDAVVTGTLAQRNPASREVVQHFFGATKALRVFDVNFRDWNENIESIVLETLPATDILKLNEDELVTLKVHLGENKPDAKGFLSDLIQIYNLKWAALSLGEQGCFLTNGREEITAPGFHVHAVDTTGCGDALVAAMVVRILEGDPVDEIARWMNLAGAFVATQKGAAPVYTVQDLFRFEKAHKKRDPISL